VSRDGIHAPDGIVGAHADPVGDGAVLALLLRQLLLDPEGLVRRLREEGDGTRKKASGQQQTTSVGHGFEYVSKED
jgi:hypothetical protein